MAFDYTKWQRWSASSDVGGNAEWNYTDTATAVATIVAANFFAPVVSYVKKGDLIWIVASDVLTGEYAQVTAVDAEAGTITVAVFNAVLGAGSVGTANLADDAVTADKLDEDAVITTKILDENVTSDKLEPSLVKHARVLMTAVQWDAMYVTPYELVAAPGVTEKHVLHGIKIDEDYGGTVFANGGAIHCQYDDTTNGGGPKATDTYAAATFIGQVADCSFGLTPVQTALADATTLGQGLFLSNATGAFTGGTNSAFIVDVWYSTVDYA